MHGHGGPCGRGIVEDGGLGLQERWDGVGRRARTSRAVRGGVAASVALRLAGFAAQAFEDGPSSGLPCRDAGACRSEAGQEVFQGLAGLGLEGLLGDFGFADAVEAEAAEVLAQLAPG